MKKIVLSILICSSLFINADIPDHKANRLLAKIAMDDFFNKTEQNNFHDFLSLVSDNNIVEVLAGLHQDEKESLNAIIEHILFLAISYPCDGDALCKQYYISRFITLIHAIEMSKKDAIETTDTQAIDYFKQRIENVQFYIQSTGLPAEKEAATEEIQQNEDAGQQ